MRLCISRQRRGGEVRRGDEKMKIVSLEDVLETYRCLISCYKMTPGMRLEEAFDSGAMTSIKKEYDWLRQLALQKNICIFTASQSNCGENNRIDKRVTDGQGNVNIIRKCNEECGKINMTVTVDGKEV